MGSLRDPIGPLPSSIYWRRRAVLLSVVAVLALLAMWAVTVGGGSGTHGSGTPDGKGPAPSITPGPSGSGPAISEQPGGRDESGEGDGSGTGPGSGDGSGDGTGDGSGSGSGSGEGGDGTAGSGGSSGTRLPAGSGLPNCTSSSVRWELRSVRNSYEPGEKPKFELIAENTSGAACKLDLGPKEAVVTISRADADDVLWSSADCPGGTGSLLLRVPAGKTVTQAVDWNREPSEKQCATPRPGSAEPGTYLAEAKAAGLPPVQASFVLKSD
ncbi:hypothetical protein [Streptomyces boluensis]|uniref:DUF4232 domain-containing protein n=1 Tax=Streptomyces boluensis TaxID=1775135 RepID=A0A964UUB6_9ACTN|nr:hypothetical protein [Streptomyces boluensis]NBE54852.1 hypothetical protein [Streptomyces boluensis]